MISIDEDRAFLIAQREKGRRGYMSGEDKKQMNVEARKQSRRETFERFRIKQKQQSDMLSAMVELEFSSSGDEDYEDVEVPITTASSSRKRKRPATNIVTQHSCSA